MEQDYRTRMSYKAAQKRIKDIKGFYVHLTVYVFVNAFIFIVAHRGEGFTESFTELSNYSTLFFWGIGLFAHWASVFGPNFLLGEKWEEKKIKEIMEKDKKQIWK